MSLKFTCPQCNAEIVLKYVHQGESAKCHTCGSVITVPADALEGEFEKPRLVPPPSVADKIKDREMSDVLVRLCQAYADDDKSLIRRLEPVATKIGEQLNQKGGIREMRRVFGLVPAMRGKRTLEMHWQGIGDWLG